MKNRTLFRLTCLFFLVGMLWGCHSAKIAGTETIPDAVEIRINPGILNLQHQGQVVTIYTILPFSDIDRVSVTLNGLPIGCWKENKEGRLAAKFSDSMVKVLFLPSETAEYTLTLNGERKDGTRFSGSTSLTIVNNNDGK